MYCKQINKSTNCSYNTSLKNKAARNLKENRKTVNRQKRSKYPDDHFKNSTVHFLLSFLLKNLCAKRQPNTNSNCNPKCF